MALYDLSFTSPEIINSPTRPFNCRVCLKKPGTNEPRDSIAKLRKCMDDDWDLLKDNKKIQLGPNEYEFCPAKVLRDDPETVWIFKVLNSILDTNTWPKAGGLEDQDSFWIGLVNEFGPLKRDLEFQKKLEIVGKAIGGTETGKSTNTDRG